MTDWTAGPASDLRDLGLGSTPGSPYLIAEAGSNHDGDLATARELIRVAASSGADAVKFQLFRAATLYPANVGVVETPIGERDFADLLATLELPPEWLPELATEASEQGIDLLFTPFDERAIELCEDLGVPALKMASPELTHLPLLRQAAATGLPLLISTGMATLGDIEEALATVHEVVTPPRIALLQCTTAYPCPEPDAGLAAIEALRGAFAVPVGFSDHTLDPIAGPAVATALGAAVIEKHITLSRASEGPDHPFAIEPGELARMVSTIRDVSAQPVGQRLSVVTDLLGASRVQTLRGRPGKTVAPSEADLAVVDRRSIHAVADLAAGHVVTSTDVAVLRGEGNLRPGLHPRHLGEVVGTRLVRDVGSGQGIVWADVLDRSGAD